MNQTLTHSQIFATFNKARAATRQGKLADMGRTNRALGVLLRKDQSWREKYQTTTHSCECADHKRHPEVTCKHIIARMIETRILKAVPASKPVVEKENRILEIWSRTIDIHAVIEEYPSTQVNSMVMNPIIVDKILQLREEGWKFCSYERIGQKYSPYWMGLYRATLERDK